LDGIESIKCIDELMGEGIKVSPLIKLINLRKKVRSAILVNL